MKRFFKIIIVFLFVFNFENVFASGEVGQFDISKSLSMVLIGNSWETLNYSSISTNNEFVGFDLSNANILYYSTELRFYINSNYNFNNEYLLISGYFYSTTSSESVVSNAVLNYMGNTSFCDTNVDGFNTQSENNYLGTNGVFFTPFLYKCYIDNADINVNTEFKFVMFFNNHTVGDGIKRIHFYNHFFATANPNNDNDVKSAVSDIQSTINSSDVEESTSSATDFFNNFDSGDTGSLMNLVSLPLKFISNLNNSCTPIVLNTGYLGTINLPCMSTYLYNNSDFAGLFNIISLVLNGLIMYGCIKSIINCVSKLKNPDNDDVEVMDL